MKSIPIKETMNFASDALPIGVGTALGTLVFGVPGGAVGMILGGAMAKNSGAKTLAIGTGVLGLAFLVGGVASGILGGGATGGEGTTSGSMVN